MRRFRMALVIVGLAAGAATQARAQTGFAAASGGFSDPFFLYYGFYLPRQQYLANQPRADDSLRAQAAQRQYSALTERAGLYDPLGSFGNDLDALAPFGSRTGGARVARATPNGITNTNLNGSGPPGYFNRSAGYYPGARTGRGGGRGAAPAPAIGRSVRNTAFGGGASVPSPSAGIPGAGFR